MEPKRELTSVDLAVVAAELRGFVGAKVDKVYLYGEDLVRLKLRDYETGRLELLIEVGDVKRIHLADPASVPDAPDRPPDFARMLRNRLSGADLEDVEQHGFDRIVTLSFDRPDGRCQVVAELFGQGNVAVLDGTGTVIDSLETVRLKSRTVAPGAVYEYPEARVDPLDLSRPAFDEVMRSSDTDVVRTLATQLNLGGLYAEELCTRAGVEKTLDIDRLDDRALERLHESMTDLAHDVREGRVDPRIYHEEDGKGVVDVTPFPLREHEGLAFDRYETFNEALDAYFDRLAAAGGTTEEGRPDFEERIERKRRIVDQQREAIDRFEEEAAAARRRAELLYTHYGLVDDVITTVREAREDGVGWDEIEARFREGADRGIEAAGAVTGVDGSTGRVTIALDDERVDLDVDVGVERNADRLYSEAKEIQEKREGAMAAIEDTREELRALEAKRDAWDAGESGGGMATGRPSSVEEGAAVPDRDEDDVDREPRTWLSASSIPVRTSEEWYERFRWFHSSDGYLVIGGRSADQNEELVAKYLEPGDRVLHATAHGGPVTVVKASGPSEPSREVDFPTSTLTEAAQFAVSYASVWKDGHFTGDAYMVTPEQISKTPESGEYLEKGAFAVRGDRTYFEDVEVGVAVGIACEPFTRVIGGPPSAIQPAAATSLRLEPGRFARTDVAKRIYRTFLDRFEDTAFVRAIAGPDPIARFLPPGGSRIVDD